MKTNKMKNLMIACVLVFPIGGVYAEDAQSNIFDGYKGIAWGTSVQAFREAYSGTIVPCDPENPPTETDKGIVCYQEENPSRLIKKRSFVFNNGKFFKVVISFNDDGLSKMETIKSSFFADFGATRMVKDTSAIKDDDMPTLKIHKYSQMYVWRSGQRSITLEKYKGHIDADGKKELRKFMQAMPQYKQALLELQMQGGDVAALEEMMFSAMFQGMEGTALQAIFLDEAIESQVTNEETY